MKVTTDACLFGAVVADDIERSSGPGVKHILDIGTGTGLLSLMIAQKSEGEIDAIEIDKDAAIQAGENIIASAWEKRIRILNEDVKTFVAPHQYDLVISNPPFYENELISGNAKKNIALHHHGLLLDELLAFIKKSLSPAGIFYLLVPFKRNTEIETIITKYAFTIIEKIFIRQSTNHNYFRIILKGKFAFFPNPKPISNELSICDAKNQYTTEFVTLLKDYYLHL